jgi:uncharacterized membrane protein
LISLDIVLKGTPECRTLSLQETAVYAAGFFVFKESLMMNFDLATLAHIHLLLNHFPTVGLILGLGLFVVGLVGKHEDLKRAGLAIFLVIGLLTTPIYMTGKAAQEALMGREGVSDVLINSHQDAAFLAFLFMEITGGAAWLGLWQYRRASRPARGTLGTVLVLSVITFGLMARAANIGGEIRHPEIQAAAVTANTEALQTEPIANYISAKNWAWPTLETLHFIGLSLLFGCALVVNLRMLGVMKAVPFSSVHRLLPWGVLGFGINLVSGMLFFITQPGQYTQNIALHYKTILMMIGGLNLIYFTMFEHAWVIGPGEDAPVAGKVMAAFTIFVWLGAVYFGRMMPFIGGSF